MRRLLARCLRSAAMLASVLVGAAAVGAGIQAQETARERASARIPGRVLTVDRMRLHLDCRGQGTPTFVLEAGATGFAASWAWVQQELGRTNRVCAYDRAGLGWSGPAPGRFDPIASAEQLRALLREGGERGPYVLVGHSLGGALASIYAARFPSEVQALALVDPPHPDLLAAMPEEVRRSYRRFTSDLRLGARLASFGVMRIVRPFSAPAASLPPAARAEAAIFEASPAHLGRSYEELRRWPEISDAFRATLGHVRAPTLIIAADRPTADRDTRFLKMSRALDHDLALRTRGRVAVVPGSDHFSIILDKAHARTLSGLLRLAAASAPAPSA